MEPLNLQVLKAKNVRDGGFFGKIKLFAEVDAGAQCLKTKVDKHGSSENARFDSTFDVMVDPHDYVVVSIYDAEKYDSENHCGTACIRAGELLEGFDGWLDLVSGHPKSPGKKQGSIHLIGKRGESSRFFSFGNYIGGYMGQNNYSNYFTYQQPPPQQYPNMMQSQPAPYGHQQHPQYQGGAGQYQGGGGYQQPPSYQQPSYQQQQPSYQTSGYGQSQQQQPQQSTYAQPAYQQPSYQGQSSSSSSSSAEASAPAPTSNYQPSPQHLEQQALIAAAVASAPAPAASAQVGAGGGKKKALLIGINYVGTANKLNGCVNDVLEFEKILRSKFGFTDITVLVDDKIQTPRPTGKNILEAFKTLLRGSGPGDILVWHYAGHGAQIPSKPGDTSELDGKDEVIVPVDMDLIADNEMKAIVDAMLHPLAYFVFVADCCHSGTIMDNSYVAVRSIILGANNALPSQPLPQQEDRQTRSRALEPDQIFRELSAMHGREVNEKNFRSVTSIGTKTRDLPPPQPGTQIADKAVVVTGCRDHQTSADAYSQERHQMHGAMTNAFLMVLQEYDYKVSHLNLVNGIRKKLEGKFEQKPCLECNPTSVNRMFMEPLTVPVPDFQEPKAGLQASTYIQPPSSAPAYSYKPPANATVYGQPTYKPQQQQSYGGAYGGSSGYSQSATTQYSGGGAQPSASSTTYANYGGGAGGYSAYPSSTSTQQYGGSSGGGGYGAQTYGAPVSGGQYGGGGGGYGQYRDADVTNSNNDSAAYANSQQQSGHHHHKKGLMGKLEDKLGSVFN